MKVFDMLIAFVALSLLLLAASLRNRVGWLRPGWDCRRRSSPGLWACRCS
jgi:hypothetical protein